MSGIGVQKRGGTEVLSARCSREDWGKDKDRDARHPALRREDGEGLLNSTEEPGIYTR